MPPTEMRASNDGIAFLVGAEIVFAIIAAACSSPQTAELNAQTRAATLMKWVKIGGVVSAGYIVAAAYWDRPHAKPIVVGGFSAGIIMSGLYVHARAAGLASSEPPTEQHNS